MLTGVSERCIKTANSSREASLRAAVRSLAESIVVTLGGAGAICASVDGVIRRSAPAIDVRDITGAGDGFVGALVGSLSRGSSLDHGDRDRARGPGRSPKPAAFLSEMS